MQQLSSPSALDRADVIARGQRGEGIGQDEALAITGLTEEAARAGRVALGLADDERRQRLAARVRHLRAALAQLGRSPLGHDHVVPIVLGERTMAVSAALLDRGFLVPGIRPPTVPAGTERLRITVSSEQCVEQLDALVDALDAILRG